MRFLEEGMKYLGKINLKSLDLNLSYNNLGGNEDNLKFIRDLLVLLPISLQKLDLDLKENYIGESENSV